MKKFWSMLVRFKRFAFDRCEECDAPLEAYSSKTFYCPYCNKRK